jgi:hypothetical protein
MAFEKRYTARQVAEAVLKTTQELLAKSELVKAETKHDRCVRHVEQNSPDVRNPHAVCVAEGVKPGNWKKSEMDKHGLSPEQMKRKLIKDGLSPNEVMARMKKYETMMSDKLGYKPSELGAKEKDQEKTDRDYEVHPNPPKNALGPKSPASHSHPDVQKSETDRLRSQTPPLNNPKEQAEGNNELAGTTPTQVGQDGKNVPGGDEIRGHLKLAKFIGRMEHKRSLKKCTV